MTNLSDRPLRDRVARIASAPGNEPVATLVRLLDSGTGIASKIAFWSAIVLPAVYLPLLVAGFERPYDGPAFLGVLALHFVALLAGQFHRRDHE